MIKLIITPFVSIKCGQEGESKYTKSDFLNWVVQINSAFGS